MTTTIPTDKYGNVYYGPKTFKEAEICILDTLCGPLWKVAQEVANQLAAHGYPRIAARVRKEYNL